jgi:HD-like signal output (HDOD) protein
MEEMVDCHELLFTGQMQISRYIEEMQSLNKKFYDVICDAALDEFSDGNITGEHLTECLDELQETKAKCDEAEKNHT